MLKKITLSLMVSVLLTQQSLAGNGNSTPVNPEQENRPIRRGVPAPRAAQKAISPDHSDDDGKAILAGLAALTPRSLNNWRCNYLRPISIFSRA